MTDFTMTDFTITDHKAEYVSSILTGNKTRLLMSAKLISAQGALHVSRFQEDEQEYLVDASFTPRGIPVYVHGHGARGCLKRAVRPDVNEALLANEAQVTLPKPVNVSV